MGLRVKIISLIFAAVTVGGCSHPFASSRSSSLSDDENKKTQLNSSQRAPGEELAGINGGETAVGRFKSQMILLADQIEKNVERKNLDNAFLVTSFTNLDRLSETTTFGRLVAENVIHELQIRKWKVFEVRLTKDVVINESGEFSLSRDIKKLKESYKIGGIVTGTYSVVGNHVIVNARVMDIDSGIVTSSAQIYLPVNVVSDTLFINGDNQKTMKIVGDTPYSCRDNPVCWNGESAKSVKIDGIIH
jgi:TolB-like protein